MLFTLDGRPGDGRHVLLDEEVVQCVTWKLSPGFHLLLVEMVKTDLSSPKERQTLDFSSTCLEAYFSYSLWKVVEV